MLSYEPAFKDANHRIVTSSALFLESMGIPLCEINAELEECLRMFARVLGASHRAHHWSERDVLDTVFMLCFDFYRSHSLLSTTAIEQRTQDQYHHFSTIYGHGKPLFLPSIKRWLEAYKQPKGLDALYTELSFEGLGRFMDICTPYLSPSELPINADLRDIAMMKCWKGWISEKFNISAYRFVARIFESTNQEPWATQKIKILRSAFRSHTDGAGDFDLIHFCFFGAFIFLDNHKTVLHQGVKAFIREEWAQNFILRVRYYKVMLNLIKQTLDIPLSLQPGLVYTIDPKTVRVTECIRIESL
ncbi:MAG: hypothetical protein ACRDFB_03875 [Rhabdochlamydiaceae bacterium]